MKNKNYIILLIVVCLLLLIPLIAMQFTDSVNWSFFDFVLMGVLLSGTGLLCELSIRKVINVKRRIILCLVIIALFLIIWAELAVGILGTSLAGS